MKQVSTTLAAASLLASSVAFAAAEDDPLLYKVMINQFEVRESSEDTALGWKAQAWAGQDLNKLWFKTEGEATSDVTEEAEIQLLYSRAVAPFWDFQMGWRRDIRPEPARDWFAIGFEGLAPYFFELDATVFIGDAGRTAARLDGEYEVLLTQRLVLTPEVEVNFHGKNDADVGTGSGLSDIEAGLRLRYEIRRELAPYLGINWWKKFGNTADFARDEGEETDDLQFVVGVRVWF